MIRPPASRAIKQAISTAKIKSDEELGQNCRAFYDYLKFK